MTDQCTANGQCIPDKELDSLLTVRDLLAVLTSIFGKEISNGVIQAAVAAPSNACATNIAEGTVVKDTPAMSTSVVAVEGTATVAKTGTISEDTPCPVNETSTVEVTTIPSISAMPVAAQSDSAGRWYAVTVGKEVGVFTNWSDVAPLVVCVSGATYPRYKSRQAADEAFQHAVVNGAVRRVL